MAQEREQHKLVNRKREKPNPPKGKVPRPQAKKNLPMRCECGTPVPRPSNAVYELWDFTRHPERKPERSPLAS